MRRQQPAHGGHAGSLTCLAAKQEFKQQHDMVLGSVLRGWLGRHQLGGDAESLGEDEVAQRVDVDAEVRIPGDTSIWDIPGEGIQAE